MSSSEIKETKGSGLVISKTCLGVGFHGHVYAGVYNGKPVAVKISNEAVPSRNEIIHTEAFQSIPGIVKLVAVVDDRVMILEHLAHGKILDFLKTQKTDFLGRLKMAQTVCKTLAQIHAMGYIHGDIHGGNILVNEDKDPVLTDFAMSGRCDGPTPYMRPDGWDADHVDPAESPPEIQDATTGHHLKYWSQSSDVYLFARFVMSRMLGADVKDAKLDDDVKGLISCATNKDPKNRPTAAELSEILQLMIHSRQDTTFESKLPGLIRANEWNQKFGALFADISERSERDQVSTMLTTFFTERKTEQKTAQNEIARITRHCGANPLVAALWIRTYDMDAKNDMRLPAAHASKLSSFCLSRFRHQWTDSNSDSWGAAKAMFEVLCAAQGPISIELLGACLGWSVPSADFKTELAQIQPWVNTKDGQVELFHPSLRSWLLEVPQWNCEVHLGKRRICASQLMTVAQKYVSDSKQLDAISESIQVLLHQLPSTRPAIRKHMQRDWKSIMPVDAHLIDELETNLKSLMHTLNVRQLLEDRGLRDVMKHHSSLDEL